VEGVRPGSDLGLLRQHALNPFQTSIAIANCLYGVQLLFSEDMGAGFARAVNDWMAAEWLDKEPRLRASIVVPAQSPEMAVDEINRIAPDKRFVQVLLLVMNDMPLGKRHYWPIYAAAVKHGLTVGIHAGSAYRHPVTPVGWPSYYTEDYAAQAAGFQQALSSLICEGVFTKFPDLKVALLESGFTWLPAHLWRLTKFWRGLRMEVPWLDRAPTEIVKSNVRLTIQPCDGPPSEEMFQKLMEHMDSDELLLFSTDYPHWQFDGDDATRLTGFEQTARQDLDRDGRRSLTHADHDRVVTQDVYVASLDGGVVVDDLFVEEEFVLLVFEDRVIAIDGTGVQ